MYTFIGLFLIFSGLFTAYHIYIAPTIDDNERVIKKGKKIKDLFR